MPLETPNPYRQYRALGFAAIPLEPRGKRPLIEWKAFQERLPTDEEMDAWWQGRPDANVGIVLGGSGRFAVDIDGDYDAACAALEERGITIPPETPRQRTARGWHLIFRAPGPVGDKVRWLAGPGYAVDIKGTGYIVVAPSVHPSGARYTWVTPLTPDPPLAPPGLLPEATPRALYAPEQPSWVAKLLAEGAAQGERNVAGTKLAGYLASVLPPDIVEQIMLLWASRCTPPLPTREVVTICRSITRRAGPVAPPPDDPALTGQGASLAEILDRLAERVAEPTDFLAFPYEPLNRLLGGGMLPNEYMLIGARPGVGKTAMALEIAAYAAVQGRRVLFVSLEMGETALTARLIARCSGLPADTLRRGGLAGDELQAFLSARRLLAELPLVIETRLHRADHIYAAVAAAKDKAPYGLVVVDYLQLLSPIRRFRDAPRLEIDASSALLQQIAQQHRTPVIAISSLSRGVGNDEPTMHHLKESGGLEFQADVIVLLHRPQFTTDEVVVKVEKARSARIGKFSLRYDGEHYRFLPSVTFLGGPDSP